MSPQTNAHNTKEDTVLVTGGSGFLAKYCILALANRGYTIRTTLRSLQQQDEVRQTLEKGGLNQEYSLSFFETDLNQEKGWKEALHGCKYVLHVASPFSQAAALAEWDVRVPDREVTLRILRIAQEVGVKRVVLTSSFATIGYGKNPKKKLFTEHDWTNLRGKIDPFIKSKTLAEKAAWEFIAGPGKGLELTVINPTSMFGPVLGADYSPSVGLIWSLLEGTTIRVPKIGFPVVDVRDVAELQVSAMQHHAAAGERFIATSGKFLSVHQIAELLRSNLQEFSLQIPSQKMPNWWIRLLSLFRPDIRSIVPNLGVVRRVSNEKARTVLDWKPRRVEVTLTDTARSLINQGLVKVRGVY